MSRRQTLASAFVLALGGVAAVKALPVGPCQDIASDCFVACKMNKGTP